jgi:transcriptional regulator with XRE-family HTH domain
MLARREDMKMKSPEEIRDNALIAAAMKAIRKARRMRPSEVARALGMPLRSYEHFEAGRGKLSYERIARFAEATNSDPLAILASIPFQSPDFAVHCADNKLMTIMMIALYELHEELGEDLTYLEPRTIIGAFTRVGKELSEHVRKRDLFAETWLEERAPKVAGSSLAPQLRWRRAADSKA